MTNKRRVVVTAEAVADIEAIGEYVALDSAYQAARLLAGLNLAIADLATVAQHYPVVLTRGEDAVR